jgi:aryl-alcohol dehydrogenase-like predicted oxidoreductase
MDHAATTPRTPRTSTATATATMDLSTWQGMRTRDPRRLTLGSAQWGMPYGIANRHGEPDVRELEAMLARAREAGVNSIDTAPAYGKSETRIGHSTTAEEGWRVLTRLDPEAHYPGLGIAETLERVSKSLEASRRALERDALPVLMLHHFAHRHACGGRLWRGLLAERDAGRIDSLGVCAATPEEAWAALEDSDIEILQVASSLLDLRLHRQGFFPRARELGRTLYVHSIFLQGVAQLEPETLPPFCDDLVVPMQTIQACAKRLGVPSRALFLAFARELPGVHPILGCETDAQLEGLLADWASDAIDAAAISKLVDSLPTLDADALDPSRWHSAEIDPEARVNRPGTASVASIPA